MKPILSPDAVYRMLGDNPAHGGPLWYYPSLYLRSDFIEHLRELMWVDYKVRRIV